MNPQLANHRLVAGELRQHESYYPPKRFQGPHRIRTVWAGRIIPIKVPLPLELNTRWKLFPRQGWLNADPYRWALIRVAAFLSLTQGVLITR